MNSLFYPKMAFTSMRKNKAMYLPYLIAVCLCVGVFYIMDSVNVMVAESGMKGAARMSDILVSMRSICGFITLVILFYVNSFVMKRRKKEFGLYSILGMEKRHISVMMVWEVLLTGVVSLACGMLGGALLSQLMFLLYMKIIHLPAALTFQIPLQSVFSTVVWFAIGFGIILLYDMISVAKTKPISLLSSEKAGEREPKSHWILAVTGVLALGAGYVLALTVKTPWDAFANFFTAVLCVIIGTYCLFISGSIVFLKALRKNKRFYYRPSNFISVSGMIYRMKQNAVGLSNICILSTAVLVTMSSCVSLFIGEEDILRERFPRDVHITAIVEDQNPEPLIEEAAQKHAQQHGGQAENAMGYYDLSFATFQQEDGKTFSMLSASTDSTAPVILQCTTMDDYNRTVKEPVTLGENEVAVYIMGETKIGSEISISGHTYRVKKLVETPPYASQADYLRNSVGVVFSNLEQMKTLLDEYNEEFYNDDSSGGRELSYSYFYNVSGDSLDTDAFSESLRDSFNETVPRLSVADTIWLARTDFYQTYGSILFVGIFFVGVFIIATVLIIYYKQITEGYDDHDRFKIMQNVGMSDKEVRQAIQKQVLMVFFLPLLVAFLHIAIAFPVLCKLLMMFGLFNNTLFLVCVLATALIFGILYFIVYQLTARTYYKIVKAKS